MTDEKTMVMDQEPQYAQPNMQQQYMPQQDVQQQYIQQQYIQQPYMPEQNMQQQYTQQPYMSQQPMQQQYTQQPYMPQQDMQQAVPQQYTQQPYMPEQNIQQQYTQQPYMPQQDMQQQYTQQPYMPQQNMNTPTAPKAKPEKKRISKNTVIITISTIVSAAILVVFFLVILPILSTDELEGMYKSKDNWIIFDDGVYLYGTNEDNYTTIGTYNVSGKNISLKSVGQDDKTVMTYDAKNNEIAFGSTTFVSKNDDEEIDCDFDTDYIKDLEEYIKTAAESALGVEAVYEEAVANGSYTIYGNALAAPNDLFMTEIATNLGYDKNETLQYIFEETDTFVDITISERGTVTVEAY